MMRELLAWLLTQKGGVRTYSDFQDKALALSLLEPENAGFARLLGHLAGRFADFYYGQPLSVSVADEALGRLTQHLQQAIEAGSLPAEEKLGVINKIAQAELF